MQQGPNMKVGLMRRVTSNHPLLTPAQQAEIEALKALSNEDIDTQDIPELADWTGGQRGLFFRPVEQQNTSRSPTSGLTSYQSIGWSLSKEGNALSFEEKFF